ncbi:hypothetical protein APS67_000336 [Streptomyces sp. AVP053U2]|nr:hypothetical protein APS67_000336 [Streptomyces sp. AVP053U2]
MRRSGAAAPTPVPGQRARATDRQAAAAAEQRFAGERGEHDRADPGMGGATTARGPLTDRQHASRPEGGQGRAAPYAHSASARAAPANAAPRPAAMLATTFTAA